MKIRVPEREACWKTDTFTAFQESLPAARRVDDAECLRRMFAKAARVPVLGEALEWGDKKNLKYFIDRTCVNIGGYYTVGTGVVGAAPTASRDFTEFACVMTHEIRHAWQDYHGMIPTMGRSFTEYNIKLALIEADAFAFEERAFMEEDVRSIKQMRERASPYELSCLKLKQEALANEKDTMAHFFMDWFSGSRPRFYGDAAVKRFAERLKIQDIIMPERKYEFRAYKGLQAPRRKGIDIRELEKVFKLGETFNGVNYMRDMPRDVMKRILNPDLSNTFYGAANDSQKQLVKAVCKKHEQLRKTRNNKDIYL